MVRNQLAADANFWAVVFTVSLVTLSVINPASVGVIAGLSVSTIYSGYKVISIDKEFAMKSRDLHQLNQLQANIRPFEERAEQIYRMLVRAEQWHTEMLAEMEDRVKMHRQEMHK